MHGLSAPHGYPNQMCFRIPPQDVDNDRQQIYIKMADSKDDIKG